MGKAMRRRLGLLTVIAILGAACSPSVGQPGLPVGSTTTVETDGTVGSVDLMALTEVLFIDEAEHFRIERAIHACMTEAGFDFAIGPYYGFDILDTEGWYGITDEAKAAEYGYKGGPVTAKEQALEEHRAVMFDIGRSQVGWEDAFFGTERIYIDAGSGGGIERFTGGCLDAGQKTVVGDANAWAELLYRVQGVQGEAYGIAEADPRVQAALAAWSDCLAEAGYQAATLEDAPYWAGVAGAVADARCNNEAGLASTWAEVQGAVLTNLFQAEGADLEGLLSRLSS